MTDEAKKPKTTSDPQKMYDEHISRMRSDFSTISSEYVQNDINLRLTAVDQAVKWMVGRGSNPTTDLIALADRIYRFLRYMPDQESK